MGGQQKHSQSNHMTRLRANTAHGKITDRDYTLQYRHRMHQWKNRGDSTTGPEKMFNFGASSLPKRIGATGRLRPEGVRSTPAITVGGVVKRATRLDTLAETAMQMQGDAAEHVPVAPQPAHQATAPRRRRRVAVAGHVQGYPDGPALHAGRRRVHRSEACRSQLAHRV